MRRLLGCPICNATITYGNSRVDVVLGSNGVRDEQINYFVRGETGVAHTSQDGVDRIARLGDEEVWRWQRDIQASGMEGNASTSSAVGNTYGTSELDTDDSVRKYRVRRVARRTYKSPKDTLCLMAKGL